MQQSIKITAFFFSISLLAACSGGGSGSSAPAQVDHTKSVKSAAALGCVINPVPVKTLDMCGTKRVHGGESKMDNVVIDGITYGVGTAPQTFEKLYMYSCVDACGNKFTRLGEVNWDCVAPQEGSGISLDTPRDGTTATTPACDKNNDAYADVYLQSSFDDFLKEQYGKDEKAPADMPAVTPGINYWEGDSK